LFLRNPSVYELSGSNLSTLLNSVVDDETNHIHKDLRSGRYIISTYTKATVYFLGSLLSVLLYMCDIWEFSTDKRRLTTELRFEKCAVRRFRRCANVYLHKPR